ncbi:MAG TPA: translational GTPase TypA [Leptospiraceae bacterium]|nr:translational GTPase TypA [Leptospirales bacterium]HMW59344.1 translational GTPase TypA [Leptospiraceae bacterium]HMX58202.1 translational GTPase TypA [Leptospiraceae bacterium]HNJ34781.1 translational GTPase TypA [Leptospiraceae bacterium]
MEIRNITIIAHVDHGKTTLVDGLLRAAGALSNKESGERVMDSMDLERERGITIRAKNASIVYKGTRINIIDTPGHADFGGEVERVLSMANCSLILVDAFEGPMPQTRFVLDKSLKLGHRPILVINKIDREFADPDKAVDMVFDLFDDLGATSEQMDFPIIYCSAKQGFASRELSRAGKEDKDLIPLLDLVLEHVPKAPGDPEAPLQFQIMNMDYDDYLGRLSIGRVFEGRVTKNQDVVLVRGDHKEMHRITKIFGYSGMKRTEVDEAIAGDIVALTGIPDPMIGDTVCHEDHPNPRPPILVDEPTVSMFFSVNDSPFAGKEGQYVTTRQLRERLIREKLTNVALRVIEDPERQDRFQVQGRGDLHLSILVETMRREGYELQVSRPEVIMRTENGQKLEPFDIVIIDLPEEYSGVVINELNRRKGSMQGMETSAHGTTRLEYIVPTRGLIGFRSFLITESRGSAAQNSRFLHYAPYAGPIPGRKNGALVSMEAGTTVAFALWNIQERGSLFVDPGIPVYGGMIIGECAREQDLDVNPAKEKKLTNMRTTSADEAVRLVPPRKLSLEQSLEFIDDDELLEVTPKSLRLRKKLLDPNERKRHARLAGTT